MAKGKKPPPPPVKPGQTVKDSGIYKAGTRKSTLVKGEPAPPTPKPGQKWKQIVDTNPDD